MLRNRIKEYRERLGISQVELARQANIASPNLSNIERGQLTPWPSIKRKLAKALKTTTDELFPEMKE